MEHTEYLILGFSDLVLIFKVTAELHVKSSNLSICCGGKSVFSENNATFVKPFTSWRCLNTFANRAHPDQAAYKKLPDHGLLCLLMEYD